MTSTLCKVTAPERDASLKVLSSLPEILDEEVQKQLVSFIHELGKDEETNVVFQEFKRRKAIMNGEKDRIRSRFL